MRLYKDSMRVTLGAQAAILKANLTYLAANLKPLAVMIVPLVLILAQLSLWFDRAPAPTRRRNAGQGRPRSDGRSRLAPDLEIETPPGLEITSPAVRIPDEHEVVWRIKALAPGTGRLLLRVDGLTIEKSVVVGGRAADQGLGAGLAGSIGKQVLYPGEAPLPSGTPVRSVEVLYPAKRLSVFGLHVHWLVAYLILSIAFGFAFKGVFKVEI